MKSWENRGTKTPGTTSSRPRAARAASSWYWPRRRSRRKWAMVLVFFCRGTPSFRRKDRAMPVKASSSSAWLRRRRPAAGSLI